MESWSPGHSVLLVPVPELEAYVVERTRHYDDAFVSADPRFGHAHVTVLGPFLESPSSSDLAAVGKIAAAAAPFDFVLDGVRAFPDGTLYLPPEPSEPFEALTAQFAAAFPQCPPYAGRFDPVVPHLTVDHLAGWVTIADVEADLRGRTPVRARADRINLQWYANHDCRTIAEWPLG